MISLHRAFEARAAAGRPGARMILTVHDELLFEAPRDEAEEVAEIARREMSCAVPLNVPLTVDVGIGANWKEAKQ